MLESFAYCVNCARWVRTGGRPGDRPVYHPKFWDQSSPMNPREYFKEERLGVFVVVIVLQKARMGNSIPTDHLKFVYEYAPTSALSTAVQGLLGRVCGHHKQNHDVKVYVFPKYAEAYSLFEQGRYYEFSEYLKTHKIKPSQRSKVCRAYVPIDHGVIELNAAVTNKEARRIVASELKKLKGEDLFINGTVNVRRLSRQTNEAMRKWYHKCIDKKINPVATRSSEAEHGKTTVFYDDVRENTLYYGYRLKDKTRYLVSATDKSFYTKF